MANSLLIMLISELILELKHIKSLGFVPSNRKGPTGVGYTLETLLEISENNLALPDIGKIEIKAHRANSQNMITLFTFNRKVWQMNPLKAIHKYGSFDENGRKGLYYTMALKPNSAGLFMEVSDTEILVRHISGEIIATWQLQTLAERFYQKIPSLIIVYAFCEERDNREYFHYYRAQLLKGTTPEIIASQFKEEHLLVDLRLHDQRTRARNHGTAFRVKEDKLPFLFSQLTDLHL